MSASARIAVVRHRRYDRQFFALKPDFHSSICYDALAQNVGITVVKSAILGKYPTCCGCSLLREAKLVSFVTDDTNAINAHTKIMHSSKVEFPLFECSECGINANPNL